MHLEWTNPRTHFLAVVDRPYGLARRDDVARGEATRVRGGYPPTQGTHAARGRQCKGDIV